MSALGLRVLRVLAAEVARSMAGLWEILPSACAEPLPENASWVEARELRKGDVIFVGPEGGAAPMLDVQHERLNEAVQGSEIEGAHAVPNQVCALYHGGTGIAGYVSG
jgi:hypothetical protein